MAKSIESLMRAARASNPDLWERTEAIAKIIAPEAFMDGWVIHPPESAKLFALKLKVLQGNAMGKAQDILKYLGVNTEADWHDILRRMAEDSMETGVNQGAQEHAKTTSASAAP